MKQWPRTRSIAEKFKTSPRAPEALFRQAQRVLKSRQQQKEMVARNLYTTAADTYPKSEWAPRALLARAEIEDRMKERAMDKVVGASVPLELLTYRSLAEKYPSYSEDALWKMSEMLEDLDRYPLQAQALTDLIARFPQTKYEAAWKLGEVREKRLKNKVGAAEAYAKVPETSSKYRDAQKKVTGPEPLSGLLLPLYPGHVAVPEFDTVASGLMHAAKVLDQDANLGTVLELADQGRRFLRGERNVEGHGESQGNECGSNQALGHIGQDARCSIVSQVKSSC